MSLVQELHWENHWFSPVALCSMNGERRNNSSLSLAGFRIHTGSQAKGNCVLGTWSADSLIVTFKAL